MTDVGHEFLVNDGAQTQTARWEEEKERREENANERARSGDDVKGHAKCKMAGGAFCRLV